MRIAVVEPDGAGGLAHYAFQLCTAMADAGADVTLVTAVDWELAGLDRPFTAAQVIRLWPAVEAPISPGRGAVLHRFWRKLRRLWRAVRYAWEWERLTRHVIRMRPDVVQFSLIRFPFQAFFLWRMKRAGLTLTEICHEFELRENRYAWMQRIDSGLARSVYGSFRVMFFHGEATADRFRALFGEPEAKVRIIPHGNQALLAELADPGGDLRSRYGIAPERPVVLFFGGLRPSKGLPELVDAFATVRSEVEAHLVIAGFPDRGYDIGGLLEQARRLGVDMDVTIDARYLAIEEVGPLLRTAALLVLPYKSATASGVLQVAYAFARPVVVTDVGDLPDSVDEGITGLVVPAGDGDALAQAIVRLAGDSEIRIRMGEAARQVAFERFGWGPIATQIIDTYRALDPS